MNICAEECSRLCASKQISPKSSSLQIVLHVSYNCICWSFYFLVFEVLWIWDSWREQSDRFEGTRKISFVGCVIKLRLSESLLICTLGEKIFSSTAWKNPHPVESILPLWTFSHLKVLAMLPPLRREVLTHTPFWCEVSTRLKKAVTVIRSHWRAVFLV